MSLTRTELQQRLNRLEDRLPAMIRASPNQAGFWLEFTSLGDVIADDAGPGDADLIRDRLDDMLRHHGAPETA